jgi:ankyrin repeat protein
MTTGKVLFLFLLAILPLCGCAHRVDRLVSTVKDQQCHEVLEAVRQVNGNRLRSLIDSNPSLVSIKDSSGFTPLHWAALDGHKEIVELLIRKGAPLNECNNFCETPLHLACSAGRTDAARMLITSGADINAQTRKGEKPITIAVIRGRSDMVKMLEDFGAHQ